MNIRTGIAALLVALGASACGVDTLTAAATAAKLKAEEAKAAQQQMERMEKKLQETQALQQQRLDALEHEGGTPPDEGAQ
ncbi:MAG: hypothetical protein LBS89_08955 [Zoogloeaceae bacterium]|nr:hypothetical protein [Zoogloeaceae bacterium]